MKKEGFCKIVLNVDRKCCKNILFSADKQQEKCNYCKKSSCNSCNTVNVLEDEFDKKWFFTWNKNVK